MGDATELLDVEVGVLTRALALVADDIAGAQRWPGTRNSVDLDARTGKGVWSLERGHLPTEGTIWMHSAVGAVALVHLYKTTSH